MFAIKTKFAGPTNHRGSRVIASGNGYRIVCSYDDGVSSYVNHSLAMLALVKHMRMLGACHIPTGQWIGGEFDTESYFWVKGE